MDESFDTIYNSEVTKTTTENGYYYIMDVNMSQYVTFVSQKVEAMGIGSEGVFGEGSELQRNKEEGSVALKIIFDNSNNIIKLEMAVTCCTGSAELYDTVINVSKQETEVEAPSWFNIANYN